MKAHARAPVDLATAASQVTTSGLLNQVKGGTAHHLTAELPHLKNQFRGCHRVGGYFCYRSGNLTGDVSAKHSAEQNIDKMRTTKIGRE